MLVAAAAAPPEGGRRGGRLLQLRVIALGRPREKFEITNHTSTTFIASVTVPLAALQGEEPASSFSSSPCDTFIDSAHNPQSSTAPNRRGCCYPVRPARCSLRAAPHALPALARSGHSVGCCAARMSRLSGCTSSTESVGTTNRMASAPPHTH